MRHADEIVTKLASLVSQLEEIEKDPPKKVNYNDFAHGYKAALKWVLQADEPEEY